MKEIDHRFNPWTSEDELEHFPSVMEWWAVEAFFKTIQNQTDWSIKVAFTEWYENKDIIGSINNITLFNLTKNTKSVYYKRDDINKLKSDKNQFHVQFENSSMSGKFPKYHMHFENTDENIIVDFDLLAKSYPHWIAQDTTNGWLPMGLGFYRYGYIPNTQLTGTLHHNQQTEPIQGTAYYEHVWGDFLYDNPINNTTSIKKTIKTYWQLLEWWLKHNTITIPNSITLAAENNPFGYDWVWAVFDNDWSIFYGNIMFWIMDGPVLGTLVLSKDGKHYHEFGNIQFHYLKKRYAKHYDFYYPTEFEITAQDDQQKIYLKFTMTKEPREYVNHFPYAKQLWIGLAICESPGTVEGYYEDSTGKTILNGFCKIEPQRQISILGHNQLTFDFIKPPKGIGINCQMTSHYLKKQGQFGLSFTPWPHLKAKLTKIDPKTINNNLAQLKKPKKIS